MTIKLHPHHIERIIELEQKNPLYRALILAVVRTLYGSETYADYREVVQRVKAGEEISVTREVGDICTNCPYQEPCISENYEKGSEMVPWFFRVIGATLSNTRDEDEKALNKLRLDESQTYTLRDLINQ